jgi:hypothetical protein
MEAETRRKVRQVEPDSEEPPAIPDLISDLPDEMLHITISLIPTKSVVQTSVLSKLWRHLWCSIPLDLTVDHNLSNQENKCLTAVTKILTVHPRPFKCQFIGLFSRNYKVGPMFDKWFRGGIPKPHVLL